MFVHRNARKFSLDQKFPELLDSGIGADSDNIRARRHEFQDALIAELDDLLDHLRFRPFENALLLGGIDQSFDSLLLRSRTIRGMVVGDARK